jgi:imidazole glycerol-phosphate synthase subunit HisF
MIKKRFIANVVVKKNIVVQSIEYKKFLPVGTPESIIKNLDRWSADEILVNSIDRSINNLGPDFDLLRKIQKIKIQTPLVYAGGISNNKEAQKTIQLGADRIVVETLVDNDLTELIKISETLGSQSVIISMPLSVNKRKDKILFYDYKENKEKEIPDNFLKAIEKKLFSELLIIDYKNQGLKEGFESNILKHFTYNVPLILYGGINGYKDIKKLSKDKRVAALGFGNTLNYAEHAIQHIKSCFSKEFSRGANYK